MSGIARNGLYVSVLLSLLWVDAANAWSISPVLVELTPARRVASVSVSNTSDRAETLQAEVLSWQQKEGADQYTETDEPFVIPAIAEIAPGETQVFRVTLRGPPPSTVEYAYRLILEEITSEDDINVTESAIKLRYRFSLPLFSSPSEANRTELHWSQCAAPANKGCVQLDNRGNRRIRLSNLTVAGDGWERTLPDGATVLAGSVKQWNFDPPSGRSQPTHVSAKSEQGAISADLPAR